MKNVLYLLFVALVFSCSPKPDQTEKPDINKSAVEAITDPTKGIGAVKNVTLNTPLDEERVKEGCPYMK